MRLEVGGRLPLIHRIAEKVCSRKLKGGEGIERPSANSNSDPLRPFTDVSSLTRLRGCLNLEARRSDTSA
jgi:hypothetical protein